TSEAPSTFRSITCGTVSPRCRGRFPSSSTELVRTSWPVGPTSCSTSPATATCPSSTRASPARPRRATRWNRASPRGRPMSGIAALRSAVTEALAFASSQPDLVEAEIFAASNRSLLARLNYTSHLPCNGVEEPKSTETYGLGIRAVFDSPEGLRIGFGPEPSDLSVQGARRALDKAGRAAVHDPEFRSLPRPAKELRALADYHDPRLLTIDDEQLVEAGWKV